MLNELLHFKEINMATVVVRRAGSRLMGICVTGGKLILNSQQEATTWVGYPYKSDMSRGDVDRFSAFSIGF